MCKYFVFALFFCFSILPVYEVSSFEIFIPVYVSTNGSDTFGDGTIEFPYATVNHALSFTIGDYIEVIMLPGRYILKTDIVISTTQRIVLRSNSKVEKVVLLDFGVRISTPIGSSIEVVTIENIVFFSPLSLSVTKANVRYLNVLNCEFNKNTDRPLELIKFEDTRFSDKKEGAIIFRNCTFQVKSNGEEFKFFKWIITTPAEQTNTPLIFEKNTFIGKEGGKLEIYIEGIQDLIIRDNSFKSLSFVNLKNPVNVNIANCIFDSHGINVIGKTENVTINHNIFTRFSDNIAFLDHYHAISYCISSKANITIRHNIFINFNFENKNFYRGAIGISDCGTDISRSFASVSIQHNDFTQLGTGQYAIINNHSITINATKNFFSKLSNGPIHCCNPTGTDNIISGNVTFYPWCCEETCEVECGKINCDLCVVSRSTDQIIIIVVITAIVVVLVLIGITIIYCCSRKNQRDGYESLVLASWRSRLLADVENLQELFENFNIKLIDYYEIREIDAIPIGRGSFGEVFKGEWEGSKIALKKVSNTFTDQYSELEQFLEEIKIMVSIDHPNLLKLRGLSIEHGSECLILITDLMENGSLEDILFKRNEQLDDDLKLSISADIAYGMHYLHSKDPGIVHRDLKPGNVLLSKKWNAKVSDFGIAKVLEHKAATLTIKGTPVYLAPECILKGKFSEKSDVFAFGITLIELYSGLRAYENIEGGSNYLMMRIATNGLRPYIPESCSDDIRELILECLCDEPDDRPNFTDILEKLSEIRVKSSLKL